MFNNKENILTDKLIQMFIALGITFDSSITTEVQMRRIMRYFEEETVKDLYQESIYNDGNLEWLGIKEAIEGKYE